MKAHAEGGSCLLSQPVWFQSDGVMAMPRTKFLRRPIPGNENFGEQKSWVQCNASGLTLPSQPYERRRSASTATCNSAQARPWRKLDSRWALSHVRRPLIKARAGVTMKGLVRMLSFPPAREIIGPRQIGLAREGFEENPGAVGVTGFARYSQFGAHFVRQSLLHAGQLERRSPPPCRGRRSFLFGDRAPPHEFIDDTIELQMGSLMHDLSDQM